MRVYEAGTRRLLSARLVDSGSSYDAQSDLPVHVVIASAPRVDVEAVWPGAGSRTITRETNVAPSSSRTLVLRTK